MLKRKIIFLLCLLLFIAIATFFSCGDAVGTDINENDIEIVNLLFFKIHNNDEFNLPSTSWEIIDCMVGDTIGLMCGLPDWNNLPKFVTARIKTSGGDIESVKLLNNPLVSYFMSVPPPQPCNYVTYIQNEKMYPNWPKEILHLFNLRLNITSECHPNDRILSISPYGDVLTAEIKTKNQILTTTLNVRSK